MNELTNVNDPIEIGGIAMGLLFAVFAIASLTIAFNMMFFATDLASAGIVFSAAGMWMALSIFLLVEVSHRKVSKRSEAILREILRAIKPSECG